MSGIARIVGNTQINEKKSCYQTALFLFSLLTFLSKSTKFYPEVVNEDGFDVDLT